MADTPFSFSSDDHLYLVDGSSFIFRAYHALPPLTRKSDGLPVGAVSGFCNMLWKLLQDLKGERRPTHLAVVFDASAHTFRNDLYDQYKAHRPSPPEDLIPQFAVIREAVRAFGVACIEQNGFEADDIIATYCAHAGKAGARVTIVGSDKDMMQLVNERVSMYDPVKDKLINREEVIEKFGVEPERVVDVQALCGDSVDNIPGVPGIGIKTAAQLIGEFGSLTALLEKANTIPQQKRRETLEQNKDKALLSLQLVTLRADVPMGEKDFAIELHTPKASELIGFLKAMEFTTLTKRVAQAFDADASAIDAAHVEGAQNHFAIATPVVTTNTEGGESVALEAALSVQTHAQAVLEKIQNTPFEQERYEQLSTFEGLNRWRDAIYKCGYFAIDTETTSLNILDAELVGVSLATLVGGTFRACYIPIGHKEEEMLFGHGLRAGQLALADVVAFLKPLLSDQSLLKIGQNMKYDLRMLRKYGLEMVSFDDTMLMSYALEGGKHGHSMDELSVLHLGHKPISFKEVTQSGKKNVSFDLVGLKEATQYGAEDADVTLRLWTLFKAQLVARGLVSVYETLERPLVDVIAAIEDAGILVDRGLLQKYSNDFGFKLNVLEKDIHELAGEPFNIASPKQLGDILFDKLQLGKGQKTATGAWATGADVLEELAGNGHALPAKVLEWRGLAKLKSTYTDALPEHIQTSSGRVHTSFALAATTTGRLSSSEPNLQNIPIRTEEGRLIRKAFVAPAGSKIVSADYSQIELRLLAEIADIGQLKEAFQNNLDIHAMTASEMFGVPLAQVDGSLRRRAKAINFGIIYGISAFGLAQQLGIGREEAGAYIKSYFLKFPGIQDYMQATKAFAHEKGYVETLFGRRCHIARIDSKNATERAFSERQAINAPIQGSAADVIRRAMIKLHEGLSAQGFAAKMILQVHDELLFEVPDYELDALKGYVVREMEQAAMPALFLSVPLKVEAQGAQNWDEAH